jgi:hypothetical protein
LLQLSNGQQNETNLQSALLSNLSIVPKFDPFQVIGVRHSQTSPSFWGGQNEWLETKRGKADLWWNEAGALVFVNLSTGGWRREQREKSI